MACGPDVAGAQAESAQAGLKEQEQQPRGREEGPGEREGKGRGSGKKEPIQTIKQGTGKSHGKQETRNAKVWGEPEAVGKELFSPIISTPSGDRK